jgi:hypothetical protein
LYLEEKEAALEEAAKLAAQRATLIPGLASAPVLEAEMD